jgi:Leucine-rich repeat (LRR) protein
LNGNPYLGGAPISEALAGYAKRRENTLAFADATSKLSPDEQIEAVNSRLNELNDLHAARLHVQPFENDVEDVIVALKYTHPRRIDITPLLAFKHLKRLHIINGPQFLDISWIKFLPLEELKCADRILFRNVAVLKQVHSLKRVNGYPADGYLDYVAREGLSGFANRRPTTIPWDVTPEQQAFFDHVAALPVEQQAAAVAKKLMEVNPKFDGKFKHKVSDGGVTEFSLGVNHVTDIWPVRALQRLNSLECRGTTDATNMRISTFANLAPLQGMQLTDLRLAHTAVSDLTPLAGMPLSSFHCIGAWQTIDLKPLAGMPLRSLVLNLNYVSDLSPLEGMPLGYLDIIYTKVSDLSPLFGSPLKHLLIENTPVSDLSLLKGMSLSGINLYGTRVADLSPLSGMPLKSLYCDVLLFDDDYFKLLTIARPKAGSLA